MPSLRITEKTAKRVSYALMAWLFFSFALALFDSDYWPLAATAGFPAGLCLGRYAEAQAVKTGTGAIIIDRE